MARAAATVPDGLVLTLDADPPADFRAVLLKGITAANAETVPDTVPPAAIRFGVMLRDGDGELRGGMSGLMYWHWLFVEALWVDRGQRGRGAGTALLAAGEAHARGIGCHAVWLDTFQARGFYEKLGYTVFGALEDYPPGQTRWFLQKRLG